MRSLKQEQSVYNEIQSKFKVHITSQHPLSKYLTNMRTFCDWLSERMMISV